MKTHKFRSASSLRAYHWVRCRTRAVPRKSYPATSFWKFVDCAQCLKRRASR